jgi:hypothetical protein
VNVMHSVMVLVAFAIAALVTYALLLAALSTASTLAHENRDNAPDDRHNGRESRTPVPGPAAGPPLPPWAPLSRDRTLQQGAPADAPAANRRSHVHC